MILSSPVGQEMPPLPSNAVSDEEFRLALLEPIEISDTDSEDVKELKAKVILAREEIKALMDEGHRAKDIIENHHKLLNDNAKIRSNALIEMKEILDSGDIEGARKYATTVNIALQQMGIDNIPVPNSDESLNSKPIKNERKKQ
jgi:hypothetical protein